MPKPRRIGEMPAVLDPIELQWRLEIVDQCAQIVLHGTRTALDYVRQSGLGGVTSPLNLNAESAESLVRMQMYPLWGACE